VKYITLFADASFCPDTKAAGIAIWARDAYNHRRRSKALTFAVDNAAQAEGIALGTAILFVLREFSYQPGDRISIQSDCLAALDLFAETPKRKKPLPGCEAALRSRVLQEVQRAGVTLCPKHVKGHEGTKNARSAVNTWCDEQARSRMREARQLLEFQL
jgi:hypothetical protein